MKLLGSKNTLAFLIGPEASGEIRPVEIWAAGAHLTHADSATYLPAFVPRLASMTRNLRERLNFLIHEQTFLSLSVEEAYRKLLAQESSEIESAWRDLRFLDLGPTTDDVLCFLVPVFGRLYLTFSDRAAQVVHATPVIPFELIAVLQATYDELSS